MVDRKRQEFMDMLDTLGNQLDEANSIVQSDLSDARDDEKMVTDEESQHLEGIVRLWDDLYTEFNILYEMAQAYEARG